MEMKRKQSYEANLKRWNEWQKLSEYERDCRHLPKNCMFFTGDVETLPEPLYVGGESYRILFTIWNLSQGISKAWECGYVAESWHKHPLGHYESRLNVSVNGHISERHDITPPSLSDAREMAGYMADHYFYNRPEVPNVKHYQ